jgi:Cd2+/Zn2+-exporting ATPase
MAVETTTYYLEGLCCADEESLIRKKLAKVEGVGSMKFDLVSRNITIAHSCSNDSVVSALREIGFSPRLHSLNSDTTRSFLRTNQEAPYTLISAALLLAGMGLGFVVSLNVLSIFLLICAAVVGGWRIAVKGIKAARHFSLDMNFLMTIAAIGAMAIGKWTEAAAIIFLFSFSELLESYSMERTRKAIRSMMDLSPATATVLRKGLEFSLRVDEVGIGDRVLIRPGEHIPLDGRVTRGDSSVNQAPITGESMPVAKKAGDDVYAGTLNERGILEIEATKRFTDTTLSRIVASVEEAQAERAPMQTLVERFAAFYTPAVFALALAVCLVPPLAFHGAWLVWFYRSLVLLVIACPCALVISTPITIVSALANAARNGVLIKGGKYLEMLGKIRTVAFDKTGTLTEGIPHVTDVIPLNGFSERQILEIAARAESGSEHHLAGAITERASEESILLDSASYSHFEALVGKGIKAVMDGMTFFVGNHALVEEQKLCSTQVEETLERLEAQGKTTIVVCNGDGAIGVIGIRDRMRATSPTAIASLRSEGIGKTILLTGDNEMAARSIAGESGIDEYYAGILPDAKLAKVEELKQRHGLVAMVGDGINDAPALAAATVGIAMGNAGTDIARETADIVLMSDDLTKLPYAVRLGRKTVSIITQNIVLAIALKLVFLVLGVFGIASLWMAVLADDGATLVVILNALRMLGGEG